MKSSSPKSLSSILAWIIYDWACSAFPVIIVTFVFATYFTEKVAINKIIGTERWGHATAIAAIAIAVLSPIFGAIADNTGVRKPWLALFTGIAIVSAALLWFIKPDPAFMQPALVIFVLGVVGLEVAQVFYNAMLVDIAPKGYLGRLSGWSWGLGYFGGLVSLIIVLFVFIQSHPSWLNSATAAPIRISGPFVAVWYLVFALPLFIWTPDRRATGKSIRQAITQGIHRIYQTFKQLRHHQNIAQFLLARLFYIDGLNTIFAFGGIYAAGQFNMSFSEIIQFGIAMNVVAGVGAILFAWLDDYKGAKLTILVSLVIMIVMVIGILSVNNKIYFWILAMGVSFCVGPVQAASRSLMARLSPPEQTTEMFGLYALSGRITAFMGPWILGTITLLAHSQRAGMSTVLFFLIVGIGLLMFVRSH